MIGNSDHFDDRVIEVAICQRTINRDVAATEDAAVRARGPVADMTGGAVPRVDDRDDRSVGGRRKVPPWAKLPSRGQTPGRSRAVTSQ